VKPAHKMDTLERSEVTMFLPWRGPAPYPACHSRAIGCYLAAALTWLREAGAVCGAFEWVALGYLGVSGALIAIFQSHLPRAWGYLAVQTGVAMLILALSRAAGISAARVAGDGRPARAITFLRNWYPQAFFLFCFEELHYLVHLIFPAWFDRWLIAFDHWLVGLHPTVWLEQFACPALNEFMQMAYITYFFYLTILGAILYKRDEQCAFWAVMTCSSAAYSIGYVISILFPIESPYHSLAALQRVELAGGFFTSLIGLVERFGRVHGAAFPSAHVSGSFVALLGAWRYRRWLFYVFLPFFVVMLVSTVYGRYHYIADVLGGLVVGGVGFWLGHRLMRLRGACPAAPFRAAL
jgi:membrane-associated phospholipid phosphatase